MTEDSPVNEGMSHVSYKAKIQMHEYFPCFVLPWHPSEDDIIIQTRKHHRETKLNCYFSFIARFTSFLFSAVTSLREGQTEFSLFLPVENNVEYSIVAKANVSKLKTCEAIDWLTHFICHCACGPDNDGFEDDEEENDGDEAQVECYIPASFVLHAL